MCDLGSATSRSMYHAACRRRDAPDFDAPRPTSSPEEYAMATRPNFTSWTHSILIFQVFHAIPGDMTGPAGQPTQAVFGIFRDLLNLMKTSKPDYLAAAFDGPGPGVSLGDLRGIQSEPKGDARRLGAADPGDSPGLRGFSGARLHGTNDGGRRRDRDARPARRGARSGRRHRHRRQGRPPVDQRARPRLLNLRKNKFIDAAELEKDWGIRPDQVVDFLALTGDTVDNVPGVPGIGEGYAATFLKEFGTLDQLLANVGRVKGPKKQQSLREHAETARRARQLVTLRDDLPLSLDWDALRTQTPGRRSLEAALRSSAAFIDSATNLAPGRDTTESPSRLGKPPTTRSIRPRQLQGFLGELKRSAQVLRRHRNDRRSTHCGPTWSGFPFSWKAGEAYYLPVRGPRVAELLDEAATLDALRPILLDPNIEKVGQNIKYDMLALRPRGRRESRARSPTRWCLAISSKAASATTTSTRLSQRLLDHTMIPITDLIGKGKNQCEWTRSPSTKSRSMPARTPTRPGGSKQILAAKVQARDSGSCTPSWNGR